MMPDKKKNSLHYTLLYMQEDWVIPVIQVVKAFPRKVKIR